MKYFSFLIFLTIGVVICVTLTFFFTKNIKPTDPNTGVRFLSYKNEELGFFLNYPENFSEITSGKNIVNFEEVHNPEDLPDGFSVYVTPTSFASTEAWIASQPIGNNNAPGIKPLVQIDGNDAYLISNYTQIDSGEQNKPIYGQILSGVIVTNKKLYEIKYRNQFPIDVVPSINPIMTQVLASISSNSDNFENPDQANIDNAQSALIAFLSKLHDKQYEEVSLYYGSNYDQLREWNPTVDKNDYAELWKNGCEQNGLNCLEIRNLEMEQKDGTYIANVWFYGADGTEFRISTPDDSSTEKTSQNVFSFTITKSENDSFKVQTMPPYTS